MKIELRPEFLAAVFAPEDGDDPGDLEDLIHDEVLKGRQGKPKGERGDVVAVVLDLSEVPNPGAWMKAVGHEIPDANLSVALGAKGYATARALNLTAIFKWYPSVSAALRQGV